MSCELCLQMVKVHCQLVDFPAQIGCAVEVLLLTAVAFAHSHTRTHSLTHSHTHSHTHSYILYSVLLLTGSLKMVFLSRSHLSESTARSSCTLSSTWCCVCACCVCVCMTSLEQDTSTHLTRIHTHTKHPHIRANTHAHTCMCVCTRT